MNSFTPGRLVAVTALILAFAAGWGFRGCGSVAPDEATHDHEAAAAPSVWTCSMHPNIQLPEPGPCPICFMDLIPLDDENSTAQLGPADLVLSESAAALAEIRTEAVQRMFVARDVQLVGKIDYDETRTASITARVPGRLERLHIDFTGRQVRRGEPLAELYSPELYAAQAELRSARRAVDAAAGSSPGVRRDLERTLESVRGRLRLWDLDDEQIARLEATDELSDRFTIRAPAGGVVVRKDAVEGRYVEVGSPLYTIADLEQVWVSLKAYESDLAWLRVGQPVTFTAPALPGREFTSEIVFVDPMLDPRTRTVEVRLIAENVAGRLKPGLLVRAVARVTLDADGDPVADREQAEPPLVIPASAPLWTGTRSVVYVRLPGRAEPTFSGREVILGPRAGHYYLVVSGLVEGERVVTNGNFKIDSALQILARPSMMSEKGTSGPTGLDHKGKPAAGHLAGVAVSREKSAAGGNVPTLTAPSCFVERLGDIVAAYLPLQRALAGDDDAAARAAAQDLETAVASVSCAQDHLPAASGEVWRDVYLGLERAARQAAGASGIGPRRLALQPLTDNLWTALTSFGHAPAETVRLFHCPMAMDGAGANWIQRETVTTNPYYGDAMLRCGGQTEVLAGPSAGGSDAGSARAPHDGAVVDGRPDPGEGS